MISGVEYDLAVEALRALFLLAVPVVIVAAVAGTIIGALQSATTIQDSALSYAVRLGAVVALLYFMLPAINRSIMSLATTAFG